MHPARVGSPFHLSEGGEKWIIDPTSGVAVPESELRDLCGLAADELTAVFGLGRQDGWLWTRVSDFALQAAREKQSEAASRSAAASQPSALGGRVQGTKRHRGTTHVSGWLARVRGL